MKELVAAIVGAAFAALGVLVATDFRGMTTNLTVSNYSSRQRLLPRRLRREPTLAQLQQLQAQMRVAGWLSAGLAGAFAVAVLIRWSV